MELEERPITLTVWVFGTYHNNQEVEEEGSPADHKHTKEHGKCECPSQATLSVVPSGSWHGCDLACMIPCQQEHMHIEQEGEEEGCEEEHNEEDLYHCSLKECDHESTTEATQGPDCDQDGCCAPHSHECVVT